MHLNMQKHDTLFFTRVLNKRDKIMLLHRIGKR